MEYDVNTYEVGTNKGKRWVAEFPGVRGVAGLPNVFIHPTVLD